MVGSGSYRSKLIEKWIPEALAVGSIATLAGAAERVFEGDREGAAALAVTSYMMLRVAYREYRFFRGYGKR